MARVIVPLQEEEFDCLLRLADSERRLPRDQAALILRRELERLGLIQPLVYVAGHREPILPPAVAPQADRIEAAAGRKEESA